MHGVKRVLAFCILTALLPTFLIILPLYLRHTLFADVIIKVTESDILEIRDGISSIFCEGHTLRMNSSFNAFQVNHHPELAKKLKHIRLKKSMTLPDDTMEYWGFYLLAGAVVELKVCSRYNGSKLLIVEGDRNLDTCDILNHNNKKEGADIVSGRKGQVLVTFETAAEVIDSHFSKHEKRHLKDEERERVEKNKRLGNVQNDTELMFNHGGEDDDGVQLNGGDDIQMIYNRKHKNNSSNKLDSIYDEKIRHKRHHKLARHKKLDQLDRKRRDLLIDKKINHGGNSNRNMTLTPDSESISSFETSLLTCFTGREILLKPQKFPPSTNCTSIEFLDRHGVVNNMVTKHEVKSNGYYYYIFYSDNDDVQNDIHAIFDIKKPTYIYADIPESNSCLNNTLCSFPIKFLSDANVVVEVPTRDGIESEADDVTLLTSTCQPRVAIYVIFPIAVLFLILTCAFL